MCGTMNCARSQFRPESNCFKYFLVDLILRDFEIYWTVLVYYKLNTHDECGPALDDGNVSMSTQSGV